MKKNKTKLLTWLINISIYLLFSCVGFSQTNKLDFNVSKTARWHFLNANFSHEFKNAFEVNLGTGFNITQLFNDNYYSYEIFIRPLPEKFTDRFSLNYGIKKYFQIKELPTRWYISYNHSLIDTKFIYKNFYTKDGQAYYQIITSSKGLLFNHNLNIGLQTKLSHKIDFNMSMGLNHIINENIANNPIKMRFEVGLFYNLAKRKSAN